MSKFFEALEQAERDRRLREASATPLEVPGAVPVVAPQATTAAEDPAVEARLADSKPAWIRGSLPAEISGDVDEHLVSLLAPATMEAEPYRALRHLVELRHRVDGLSVVVVSSPAAGDGKTTTAINLAGALAQDPAARVLLIDGDLRQSAVPQRLGLDGSGGPGLVDAILDPTLTLDELARPCPPYNLWLVAAGHRPGMPYELLASPRLGELLEAARRRFDYVVVDAPPLVLFPDCRLMAAWVDAFLVVVAAHRTPRKLVEEALNAIEPAKLLGLVFNGDDRPLVSRYYRYGYARNGGSSREPGRRWLPRLGRGGSGHHGEPS
jgi:capsular exopolysaccharide synthesis family protein